MSHYDRLRRLLDELNAMIGEGTVEIDGIFGDDEREESIDWLAPGGAVVINNATGEVQWIAPKPQGSFTGWDGLPVLSPLTRFGYHMHYVPDLHGRPRPTDDEGALLRFFRDFDARVVAKTKFRFRGYRVEVSTMFLTYNCNFWDDGPPLLFETMIFSSQPELDGMQYRYATRKEAKKGHRLAVNTARAVLHALTKHGGRRMKAMLRADGWQGGIYEPL